MNQEKDKSVQRPELHLVTRTNEEVSIDGLGINNFENYVPNDYQYDILSFLTGNQARRMNYFGV